MRKVVLLFFFSCLYFFSNAATYYWVGGSGTWGTAASFATSSGGSGSMLSPTSADIVVFDQNSGNPTVTVTGLTINVAQLQLNTTGASVTVALSGTATSFAVSGSTNCLTISSNCTLDDGGNTISLSGNITGSGTHTSTNSIVIPALTTTNASMSATTAAGLNIVVPCRVFGRTIPTNTNIINYDNVTGAITLSANATSTSTFIAVTTRGSLRLITAGATIQAVALGNLDLAITGTMTIQNALSVRNLIFTSNTTLTDINSSCDVTVSEHILNTGSSSAYTGSSKLLLNTTGTTYFCGNTSGRISNIVVSGANGNLNITDAINLIVTSNINLTGTSASISINANGATLTIGNSTSATISQANSNVIKCSAGGNIVISSTTNIGTLYFDQTTQGTTNRISQFTLTAGSLTLGNSLQTTGTVTFTAGTLTLGSNASFLVSSSTFTRVSGIINASNATSTFRLTTSSAVTVPSGLFNPATVANFVDSSNSSSTFAHTLGSAITVTNFKLAITSTGAFTCTNSSNLTIASGGSITMQRTNTGTVTLGTAPTFAGTVDINYLGSQLITTGVELPTSTSAINNLTINTSAGTTGITLGANATVNGTLFLSSGAFTLTNTLSMANGTTIVRGQSASATSGSLSAAPTFGTGVNITILGTAAITSANELPTGGSYGTLTVNNTSSYSLAAGISITVNSLIVGSGGVAGVFQYANNTSVITLNVTTTMTIGDGATFQCPSQTSAVVHVINVGGNISIGNTSSLNFVNSSTKYIALTLNSSSASNQTISSTGTPTSVVFGAITLNRGTAAYKVVCSVTASTTGITDIITYTSGTWEQSAGTFAIGSSNTQSLPVSGNGNITVSGTGAISFGASFTQNGGTFSITGSGSVTFSSALAISGGTFSMNTSGTVNIGSGSSAFTITNSASVTLTGGTFNINGRLQMSNSAQLTINGATLNIPTGGTLNTGSNSIFAIVSTNTFNFFNGSINVRSRNANISPPTDIIIPVNLGSISGGTFTVSDVAISVNIATPVYNFTVANGSGTAIAKLVSSTLQVSNNLTLTSGTLDAASNSLNVTVGGILALTAGTFSIANSTLTLNGPAISVAAGTLSTTSSTNLVFGGTDAGPLNIPSTVTALNNLTLNNTNAAPATLNVTAASLALSGALAYTSGTINMGTNTLSSVGGTISGTGTLKTSSTTASPIPASKTWTGTVNFTASNGSQSIPLGTYNNLQLDNSSGTNTATGNITVNGILTTTAGGIFDLTNAYTLAGTLGSITNNGTISTAVPTATSATPVASAKTWGGTGSVAYNGTAAQTVVAGNYYNLNLTASSVGDRTLASSGTIGVSNIFTPSTTGVHTVTSSTIDFNGSAAQNIPAFSYNKLTASNAGTKTATGNIDVASTFTIASAVIVDMVSNVITGASLTTSGTGTLKTQNTSSTPLPTNRTWAFAVEYNNTNGAQTIMGGTYTTALTISNSNATASTGMNVLSNLVSTTVNGVLTLNTNANLALNGITLTLGSASTITGTGTLSGAGAASSVSGAVNGGTLNITGSTQDVGTINFSTASTQASTLGNMTVARSASIITIGTCSSNTLTITGTLALNAGTLNDGGNTITIGGGSFVSTTNTINGAAVHTGTGSLKYTRSSGNLTSGTGTFLSLGNVNVAGSGTQTISTSSSTITINGTLNFGTTNNIALNSQTLIVATSGTINVGTNQLTGAGTVTINGIFKTANTSGLTGSIPTATISTLGSSSTIEYTSSSSHAITARTDYNNLTLSGGSSKSLAGDISVAGALKLSASSDKLSIGSNTLSLNGSIDGTGAGFITGSAASNISIGGTGSFGILMMDQSVTDVSNMVQNLTINRTGQTATLGNALRLAGVLTPTAGTIASAGNLTIASTATNTARIAAGSSSGGYITGNVTVERYISSSGNRAYRLLTPSVNTSTTINANWQEGQSNASTSANQASSKAGYGTHITGTGGSSNGFDATLTNQASLYIYNPLGSWDAVTNTNVNTLSANTGYLLFVRGNRDNINVLQSSTPSSNTTLRATGTLPQGSISFTGLSSNTDFSLVTNPYASPILWDNSTGIYTAGSNATNFENYITIWDPNIGTRGGYVTVTTGNVTAGGTTNLTNEIQSGQAFFVQTKSGITSPTLSLLETHKSTNNNLNVFRNGTQTETLKTLLFYNDNAGVEHSADGVTSIFSNAYSNNIDGEDALQIDNWDEDVAISRSSKLLSIEARKLADVNDTIPLSIARLKTQAYKWKLVPQNFNAPGLIAQLRDNFTNTNTPISLTDTTVISFAATADVASKAADRFSIVFKQNSAVPVSITSIKAYQKNQGIAVEWIAQQEINMNRYEVEKSIDGTVFNKVGVLQSKGNAAMNSYNWFDANPVNGYNYYRIKSIEKSGKEAHTQIVNVVMGKAATSINIYPNPILDNKVNIKLYNVPKGDYSIVVTNAIGQQVFAKKLLHNGGSAIEAIALDSQLASGIYYLKLLAANGTNWQLQFVKP